MRKILKILLFFIFYFANTCFSEEFKYILKDKCITELYNAANFEIKDSDDISVIRDSRGIIIRFPIDNPADEYDDISPKTHKNIVLIKNFLAKIKNLVIIEVHTDGAKKELIRGLKNWEVSTVIANNIRETVIKSDNIQDKDRIFSVGYGEFLPLKNTPFNGGKFLNRVDIIVLCNISGE